MFAFWVPNAPVYFRECWTEGNRPSMRTKSNLPDSLSLDFLIFGKSASCTIQILQKRPLAEGNFRLFSQCGSRRVRALVTGKGMCVVVSGLLHSQPPDEFIRRGPRWAFSATSQGSPAEKSLSLCRVPSVTFTGALQPS